MVREQGVRVRDIADLPWVSTALAALHAGGPLPLPFDDPASASENLGADRRKEATAANAPVTPRRPTRPSPRSNAPPQPPTSRAKSVSRKTIVKQETDTGGSRQSVRGLRLWRGELSRSRGRGLRAHRRPSCAWSPATPTAQAR
jgi:hypothetical protein